MDGHDPKRGLILSGNVGIGYQVASLLEKRGWLMNIVHNDLKAYDCILKEKIDVVIADIDAIDLGGMAILAFCHHRYPAITTYAIIQADDDYGKRMARDAGGCQGYFYFVKGRLQIDPDRGIITEFVSPDLDSGNESA